MNQPTPIVGPNHAQAVSRCTVAATPGECYVPLRKDELIELLVRRGNLDSSDAASFRNVCRLIEALFHFEFRQRQEHLKRLYAPFDPDSDTRPLSNESGRTRNEMIDELLDELAQMLIAAHYYPLSPQELERALEGTTYWGLDLKIDLEIFDRLMIYVRGDSSASRVRRDLGTWFRRRVIELELYERLVLAVKIRPGRLPVSDIDTDNIYLKMFREIPKLDLEMLLPGTQPRMRWFDVTKIGGTSLGGLWSLSRFILYSKWTWFMVAVGTLSYALQSFLGYRITKAGYIYNMTRQLYYQNLDNNMGVFCRVIDEAEDAQTKEAILAYYFLWRGPEEIRTPDVLGSEIEKLLRECAGESCRFQAREAITKLKRLGVLTVSASGLQALAPDQAVGCLSEHWANCLGDLCSS